MSRKFIFGLALAGALALGSFGSVNVANAQSAPICSTFGPNASDLDSWGPCTAAPNIVVTTSNVGSIGGVGDYYLHLRDTAGASAACSSNRKYLGNWIEKMGGCGQFCFDFKVFKSGTPPGPITPSFTIWSGPTAHATFVANFTVTSSDKWRHICAPVNLSDTPPANGDGHWVVTGGTWNAIASNVTMMQLPIDWTSDPSEEAGYDNLCMNPQTCNPPPPVIDGCLKDSKVAVKCNGDGTYTLTLGGSGFTGTTVTISSQTAGVTVTPPQQPWSPTMTWTITGATPGQTVVLAATTTKAGGGKDPGTDECCSGKITIVMPDCPKRQVGEVVVEKKVKNGTRATNAVINNLIFPVGLSCTAPPNLNVSFGLNNGGTHTENNVPYTSICTVTESMSTLPPVPKGICGEGSTAVWLTPIIAPASATVNAPVTAFTVVNDLECRKIGQLSVSKTVFPDTRGVASNMVFPMTVTCTNPSASYSLNVHNNTSTVPFDVPVGSQCTVSEAKLPALPAGCTWQAPVYTPASVTIAGGLNQDMVRNSYTCHGVDPSCVPPMTLNVDGICGCPPPSTPGAVLNTCLCPNGHPPVNGVCEGPPPPLCPPPLVLLTGGACGCPQGTVLRNGKCVSPIECRRPLIPNAAGTECVCRDGYIKRGRTCVERLVCREPATLNSRGTACVCPRGMVLKGNTCVERGPRITPNDVIRNIPGVFGPGRDNPREPRGGGDKSGPTRGGGNPAVGK